MNVGQYVTPEVQLSDFATERTITLGSTQTVLIALAGYGFSVVMMALSHVLPSVLTVPFVVLSLSFVPGSLLLVSLGREEQAVDAEHVLYAFGSSLVILMVVGVLVNVLLPLAGVARPLMAIPLGAGVSVTVGLLAIVARWRNPAGTISFRVPPLWSPVPLALGLLPLLSIIGVVLINATGFNVLLLVILLAVGALPLVAIWRLHDRWYSLAIWTVALAILYHKSLWQYSGFGGRPHGINAWKAGRWSPGVTSIDQYSTELVQNGVLFPLFARLSDLFIMTQYEVVNPFFVSFIPLALYVTFRRYVTTDSAFLGATVFVFVHPFYLQYPTAGRAATPVLFLALFGVALSNEGLSSGSRAALAVAFLTGVVVSHYGTSYYVAAAFILALVLLYSLRFVDEFVSERLGRVVPVTDGGAATPVDSSADRRLTIFSPTTVFFFISISLGWYLYTRGGWKFDLLPKHVYENITTLISGPTVDGRTSARIQESYSSMSIEIAKYIYVLLAVLIAVGLAVVFYRRIVDREQSFDDHYLTIATALFGIFGITIILRNWGGGRPMMITFSFTTVFAVLGTLWLTDSAERISPVLSRYLPWPPDAARAVEGRLPADQSIGTYAFASLLLVLLLLNTGVAAATIFGGFAPSNVPAQSTLAADQNPQSQVTVHRETDIVTHVWLVQHLADGNAVYGDTFAARQFDWYRPDIAARMPSLGGGYTPETKPEVFDVDRQRAGTQPGYTLVMGHNLALDAVWPSKFGSPVPLEDISTEKRNRIYTTGESHIYHRSDSQQPESEESKKSTDDSFTAVDGGSYLD